MPKVPPPLIGLLCATAMWLLAKYIPVTPVNVPATTATATLVATAGLLIDFIALWSFRKAKTTINPLTPHKSSAVVNTGIYRYSRNPMYLGMLLLLIALAIYLCALSPWIVPACFVWIITHNQIKPEEAALEKLFGQSYLEYKNSVRRWI